MRFEAGGTKAGPSRQSRTADPPSRRFRAANPPKVLPPHDRPIKPRSNPVKPSQTNPQSAIPNPRSPIPDPQSAIRHCRDTSYPSYPTYQSDQTAPQSAMAVKPGQTQSNRFPTHHRQAGFPAGHTVCCGFPGTIHNLWWLPSSSDITASSQAAIQVKPSRTQSNSPPISPYPSYQSYRTDPTDPMQIRNPQWEAGLRPIRNSSQTQSNPVKPIWSIASSITPSLHHSTTPSLHHSTTPPLRHSTTPPLHHSATPPLRHSATRDRADLTDAKSGGQ